LEDALARRAPLLCRWRLSHEKDLSRFGLDSPLRVWSSSRVGGPHSP
jgi:hypothetical protein